MVALTPLEPEQMYKIPEEHLHVLLELYTFESNLVSKIGKVGESLSPSWSISDAVTELGYRGIKSEQVENCIEWLWSQRRLIPLNPNSSMKLGFENFRTDTCELIRQSSFTYPRLLPPSGVSMQSTQAGVTWRIEEKKIPQRSITIDEALKQLENLLSTQISENHNLLKAISIAFQGFEEYLIKSGFSQPMLSDFQIKSVSIFIKQNIERNGKNQLISAGTGSGKTFGFQLGIISLVIFSRLNGHESSKIRFLMVYPRVALALDQYSSFNEILHFVNDLLKLKSIEPIISTLDAGSQLKDQIKRIGASSDDSRSTTKAVKWTYGIKKPDVIVTNPDSLKNRLWQKESSLSLKKELQSVVLDEVHLYEGLTGANYSNVIRRLGLLTDSKIHYCGVSATIADGKQHMENVTGCNHGLVEVIKPESEDLILNGLVHHILHAQVEGSSYISNLTNMTSLQQHQRNRRISRQVNTGKEIRKGIGFADSLHLLGQWNHFLAETEGLRPLTKAVRDNLKKNNGKLSKEFNPVSNYPLRFNRPLTRLVSSSQKEEAKSHCEKCVSCQPSTLLVKSPILVDSIPHTYTSPKKSLQIEDFVLKGEIGITDSCPLFNKGWCWREEIFDENIELWNGGPKISAKAITPVLLTSDTIKDTEDPSNPDNFFVTEITSRSVLARKDIEGSFGKKHIANIALSSPSMEVGVDLSHLTDAILFKAIRNVASYRQKVGRLGREGKMDTVAQTLVSFRPLDYHYYQNPVPLLSNSHVDAIPIASSNENVIRNRVFHGILDQIASFQGDFWIVSSRKESRKMLNGVVGVIRSKRNHIQSNLQKKGVSKSFIDESFSYLDKIFVTILQVDLIEVSNIRNISQRLGSKALIDWNTEGAESKKVIDVIWKSCISILSNLHRYRDLPKWNMNLEDSIRLLESAIFRGEITEEELKALNSVTESLEEIRQELINQARWKDLSNFITPIEMIQEESIISSINQMTSEKWMKTFLIRDWNDYCRDNGSCPIMFDELVRVFRILNYDTHFSMPKNLYTSPGTKMVDVWIPSISSKQTGRGSIVTVTLDEARYSYLPGMHTYRKSGQPLKSNLYQQAILSSNNVALVDLNSLSNNGKGHEIVVEKLSIVGDDLPWGFDSFFPLMDQNKKIEIRTPRKLITSYAQDQMTVDFESMILLNDGDDYKTVPNSSNEESEERFRTNLPSCHAINWQKVSESLYPSSEVKPFNEDNRWKVQFDISPILGGFFENIFYFNQVDISEFTAGFSRRYTGVEEEAIFVYTDSSDPPNPTVIGSTIKAPALKFKLRKETIDSAISESFNSIKSGEDFSQLIAFIKAGLISDWSLNTFLSEHFLRIISEKIPHNSNLQDWIDVICSIKNSDISSYSSRWEENWSISGRKPMGINRINEVLQDGQEKWNDPGHIRKLCNEWLQKSYIHSLGIHILQAARATSGCRDEDIGLHFDENEGIIWLYDRVDGGSGAINTVKRWFEIPRVIRDIRTDPGTYSIRSEFQEIPSNDFRYWFLLFIRPCLGRSEISAAIKCNELNVKPKNMKTINKFIEGVNFILENHASEWDNLPGKGQSFESLQRSNLDRHRLANGDQSGIDSIRRRTTFCTTSCPMCLEELSISPLGPLLGPIYSNKRLLDYAFNYVIELAGEKVNRSPLNFDAVLDSTTVYGTMDQVTTPINLPGGNKFRPLLRPELICQIFNDNNPVDIDGKINQELITAYTFESWRLSDV